MTFLWPQLADCIGVCAHCIAGASATYLAFWCWRTWKQTRLPIALALAWLGVIIALLSVYRFSDILTPNDSMLDRITVEFGVWIRVGLASTLSYLAWSVWKAGRREL